jgi:hypothetical protein
MAFTNGEIEQIHRIVGGLCERRAPDHVKHEIRLSYSIANHDVVICEERPFRNQSSEWIVLEIAKLRYVRKRDEWQLHGSVQVVDGGRTSHSRVRRHWRQ